jgi:hypothetical protein
VVAPATSPASSTPPTTEAAPTTAPPTTAPPTTAAELPAAADGTDVRACKDGTCQILVTGAVDVPVRKRVLQLALEDGGLTVTMQSTSGGRTIAGLGGVGGAMSIGGPGTAPMLITLDGIRPGAAVVRIQPA